MIITINCLAIGKNNKIGNIMESFKYNLSSRRIKKEAAQTKFAGFFFSIKKEVY